MASECTAVVVRVLANFIDKIYPQPIQNRPPKMKFRMSFKIFIFDNLGAILLKKHFWNKSKFMKFLFKMYLGTYVSFKNICGEFVKNG